mmetsp:Transcript_37963/g.60127  ORF Transcript_37963/g.60127 Transcript_37963/m.60127 type:complete len:136 (+) Transcript_37963:127-534(+)
MLLWNHMDSVGARAKRASDTCQASRELAIQKMTSRQSRRGHRWQLQRAVLAALRQVAVRPNAMSPLRLLPSTTCQEPGNLLKTLLTLPSTSAVEIFLFPHKSLMNLTIRAAADLSESPRGARHVFRRPEAFVAAC